MAEKISLPQPGSTAFHDALLKVLTEERYMRAAQALSVKIRAHKRTPVQQAAGEHCNKCSSATCPVLDRIVRSHLVRHDSCLTTFRRQCQAYLTAW